MDTVRIELEACAGSAASEEAHPASGPHRTNGVKPALRHPGRIDGKIKPVLSQAPGTDPLRLGDASLNLQGTAGAQAPGQLES